MCAVSATAPAPFTTVVVPTSLKENVIAMATLKTLWVCVAVVVSLTMTTTESATMSTTALELMTNAASAMGPERLRSAAVETFPKEIVTAMETNWTPLEFAVVTADQTQTVTESVMTSTPALALMTPAVFAMDQGPFMLVAAKKSQRAIAIAMAISSTP